MYTIKETITKENIENILREESGYSNDFKELIKRIIYMNDTNKIFAGFILINYTLLFLGNAKDVAANLADEYIQNQISSELPNEFDALSAWKQMSLLSIKLELQLFIEGKKGEPNERDFVKKIYDGMSHIN